MLKSGQTVLAAAIALGESPPLTTSGIELSDSVF